MPSSAARRRASPSPAPAAETSPSKAPSNGAKNLTVTTSRAATFNGTVGGTTALTSLVSNAATTNLNASVTTTGTPGLQRRRRPRRCRSGHHPHQHRRRSHRLRHHRQRRQGPHRHHRRHHHLRRRRRHGTALASLTTDAGTGGSVVFNAASVTTTGDQSFGEAGTLGADVTFTGTNVTFGSTLNGAQNLIINASGTTAFLGEVGGTAALTSVTTDAPGDTTVSADITTTADQTYNDNVNFGADATLTGVNVTFADLVDGAQVVVVDASGATTFGGLVGAVNALASLTTDAAGTVVFNATGVNTTGGQTYNDAATLGANVIFGSSAGGDITFANTVNGAFALTANTGGTTTFGGAVTVATVTTDAAGDAELGADITTTGDQTYNDDVTVTAAAVTLDADDVFLNASTDLGANELTVDVSGVAGTSTGPISGAARAASSKTAAASSRARRIDEHLHRHHRHLRRHPRPRRRRHRRRPLHGGSDWHPRRRRLDHLRRHLHRRHRFPGHRMVNGGQSRHRALTLDSASTCTVPAPDGTTPGTGPGFHDQLAVTGVVSLGGATLDASAVASRSPTELADTIIENDGDDIDPVVGTFDGLAEGPTSAWAGRTSPSPTPATTGTT